MGSKRTYVPTRENKYTEDTKNILRPLIQQKIKVSNVKQDVKVYKDPGKPGVEVKPGTLTIDPGDVFMTEGTFRKLINANKKYNAQTKKISELVKSGKITKEAAKELKK